MTLGDVRALVFDVFGTVVDWRSTVIAECRALGEARGIDADWARFADAWRARYQPSLDRVRSGELGWRNLDALHRASLEELVREFGLGGLSQHDKEQLNRVWHRLEPWPDAVGGLARLRRRYVVATLSNGNVALLVDLSRHAGLDWDCILSAELAHAYKPDAVVYRTAADLLGLPAAQVAMVAAHLDDLRAARAVGMRTAFVARPEEFGPAGTPDLEPDESVDVAARDFHDLAERLGA